MSINQDYINKLSELSNEVLKEKDLNPSAKILIQTLMTTTQILFNELKLAHGEIVELKERVRELEVKSNKDSHNSHLPPSTDKNRYPKKKGGSGNSSGGQSGHKGSTLRASQSPDKIVKHKLKGSCQRCGTWLRSIERKPSVKRQVFDLKFQVEVTEHQAEHGICSCGKRHTASFPDGVNAFVQYGSSVRGLVNYLSSYQLVPFERLEEIFKDIFNLDLCEGTIFNTNKSSFKKLEKFESKLKEALLYSDINHADETPIKIGHKQSYLHVLSNESMTLIKAHVARGTKAVNEIGILNKYTGVLSSDFFAMYYSYKFKNAVCHSHLCRELTLMEEEYGCRWAHQLRRFLQDLNSYLDDYRDKCIRIPEFERSLFEEEYKSIIFRARIETQSWNYLRGDRTPPGNLLYRIIRYEEAVLRFMNDLRVPFTNNLAERDLRMAKVRQKISGCFRSFEGAEIYARFRSYLSTVKKQGRNVWEAIKVIHEVKNPNYIELFT
jgi:transposase